LDQKKDLIPIDKNPRGGSMKLSDEVKVSLVTAVCILALAIVSKNILNVQLDFISLYGPVMVFIVYIILKDNVKKSEIGYSPLIWSLVIIFMTAAILILYSL
jgi:EamA domain-containing membrane protein RarD